MQSLMVGKKNFSLGKSTVQLLFFFFKSYIQSSTVHIQYSRLLYVITVFKHEKTLLVFMPLKDSMLSLHATFQQQTSIVNISLVFSIFQILIEYNIYCSIVN